LDEQGQPLQPDLPSVLVDTPADKLQLVLDHSVTGALHLPEGMTGLFVRDSIIDSPRRSSQADFSRALVSGSLSPFPGLSSSAPQINVTIGDEGPYLATLSTPPAPVPATLADARDALQQAIRAAHYTIPFTAARVLSVSNRLVVFPGSDEKIVIEVAGSDPAATELRLDPASSRETSAVISGPLTPFPTMSPTAQVNVTSGTDGPSVATFAGTPSSVAQARDQLQVAIRAAGITAGFTGALVANIDDQLVVLSGDGASPITFSAAAADSASILQLKLATERPAIAADEGGDLPGPPTTLVRTTIFGEVHVQQLQASEVIFTSPAFARRRQEGCVRFSYVPEGSETPRRYRCQPDFEIAQRMEEAERAAGGTPISDVDRDAIRDDVRGWLQPSFTDVHYGLPGYCQLLASCPEQIQTGAEDGSEMGVFCFLKQPQRVTSLRVRLQEYLPFGLEPGLIYVT
jgi:hypothetical protein